MIRVTLFELLFGGLALILGAMFIGSLILGVLEDDYSGALIFGFFLAICVILLVMP